MGIFSGLFKSRDKPTNSYDSPSYAYFSAEAMQEKESPTEQPYSISQFMLACGFCQKPLLSCHYTFTNIPKTEKSECHSTRFTFCSTINQILK